MTHAPSSLPPLLQPWADQLSLFPPELAAALGELLLRLKPLVGPFMRNGADRSVEPAGVGDIANRGSYDRLLLSEWAVADAAPDEFLRRAANAELLFTGPEPAHSVASLRSVALFDAGPAQLGAPRLAHLAMFILLARRAELAGAAFQWGVLQQPGVLHADQDRAAVQRLLDARVWDVTRAADLARWDETLDASVTDCWLVGGPVARPARVHAVATVREAWQGDALEIGLLQRGRSAGVSLALPEARIGARLLRKPFEAEQAASPDAVASDAISTRQAPLFGTVRDRIAVCMVNGSATLFHVPETPGAKPGRPRKPGKIGFLGAVVAAGVFQKSFASVAVQDYKVRFSGFPGPFFCNQVLDMPPRERFHAVPGALRWSGAFHQMLRDGHKATERVMMLDREGRLVGWTITGRADTGRIERREFAVIAEDVVGAVQQGGRVLFAARSGARIDVYSVDALGATKSHLSPVMHGGNQFLFGETREWRGGGHLYALRMSGTTWLVGQRAGAAEVRVDADDIVLGCARLGKNQSPGLVVLAARRTRIELATDNSRTVLVHCAEGIVRASFDPEFQRFAWLQKMSGVLTVQRLGDEQPLLRTLPRGDHHGE